MTPLSEILKKAESSFPGRISIKYSHPTLYAIYLNDDLRELAWDARLERFAKALGMDTNELSESVAASTLQLVLATSEERTRDFGFLDDPKAGHHWVEFLGSAAASLTQHTCAGRKPLAVHFYGFKGGQGRSTVLALMAKQLADDGYRVLVVDADLEAPSLDLLFAAKAATPSATFMGCSTVAGQFRPLSAYTPRQTQGVVDIIPCRPLGAVYDLDFAAFILRSSLDVVLPEDIAIKIRDAAADQYDILLFDHRSGLSSSILPIMSACPGPVAICLRLDEQSSAATGFFEILLRQNVDYPGLFVSFSLDPEDTLEKMRNQHAVQIDGLLSKLSQALALGTVPADNDSQLELALDPNDLLDYWVPWFHDRALLGGRLPALSDLSKSNLGSLQQIRGLIGLSGKKEAPSRTGDRIPALPALSGSGATDEGLFIETEALRKLTVANTPHTYIFGRKGTGKTRLLRELAIRRLGEPLVVASDFRSEGGIPSSEAVFKDISDKLAHDPEKFWWVILGSALGLSGSATRSESSQALLKEYRRIGTHGAASVQVGEIVEAATQQTSRRVFLIDGIETAFLSSRLLTYLEGLFKFLLAIQTNPKLQDKVIIRLFLRTDLARRAFQNIEQQISGRVIYLSWDTQSILNFVLSRISVLPWFKEAFPDTVAEILGLQNLLVAGDLGEDECDRILSQIFPQKIRRNNLLTLTFLKTYFSDSAGQTATYYPRIYDRFLQLIANPADLGRQLSTQPKLEDGRVSQGLIFAAHEQAAKDYLQQVEAELVYLLQLAGEQAENTQRVKELLQAFAGLPTPFLVDDCVRQLRTKLDRMPESEIRAALVQMREIGIFEDRPGYAGEWRVGRLFKASLGMKYVR